MPDTAWGTEWRDMNTTEQALNSWNLHSHCLTLRQLCEVGTNAPVLQMRKPGLRDVKKMSLGHTFVSPQISCSSWDEHWTPFAKAVCVLEISTTTMLPFSRRDFNFPPAAQINFPLPADPGRGWRQLHHRRAKRKWSSKDKRSQKASELSIQLPDLLFLIISRERPLLF